jgi:hypothetical protein
MNKNPVTLRCLLRALALSSLIALNTALPAEASLQCYNCFTAGGDAACLGGALEGFSYCYVFDNACWFANSCTS